MGDEQKNAMVAVVLSAIVLITWQSYFVPKVEVKKSTTKVLEKSEIQETQLTDNKEINDDLKGEKKDLSSQQDYQEVILTYKDFKAVIGNDLSVNEFISPKSIFTFKDISGDPVGFRIQVFNGRSFEDIVFNLNLVEKSNLVTGYNLKYDLKVAFSFKEDGKLNLKLVSNNGVRYRVIYNSKELSLDNRQIRSFIYRSSNVNRIEVGEEETLGAKVLWTGIDFNFHLIAFVTKKKIDAKISSFKNAMHIEYTSGVREFEGDLVFTKKNYDDLVKFGSKLEQSVDFGIFGIIAVPILRGLQFLYKYIENYGFGIVILTILIRLLTSPLQLSSIKSMKKMQKVQPELNKLKEKYKDDQERIRKETMELFKKSGANPIGGCLPMLLQMPFFFAFYQVLYNSVELVEAPFIFWIVDLSIKDPYYVLPVLMGVSFFLQTHLNPTPTADPTQKKIMYIMPLVFCFIMKDLPAGLNLYMVVSTIFGIAQQKIVFMLTDDA